ncbi:MAG: Na+/H+ antiporter subunit E [Candidatus Natronoplasma sp.]
MSRMPLYLRERISEIQKRVEVERYEALKLPKWEQMVITWVALFSFWMLVSASLHWENVLIGGLTTIAVSALMYNMITDDIRQSGHVIEKAIFLIFIYIPQYIFIMAFRLLESNFKVMKHAIFMDINPGIVKIDTELHSRTGVTILANSISLTPGTLTVDSDTKLDQSYLYVHWIDVETLRREKAGELIKGGLEEWLKKIFW